MRGSVEQRSPGSWAIRIDLGRGPDGNRRQKRVTVRGTKREAERELARILNELSTGALTEPSRMTVGDYMRQWLADYAKPKVSNKTYETYEEFVRLHLTPNLGHHRLSDLKPLHIQRYYSKALQSGRADGKGGLSARTVLHHHRVLREALQQAVKWQVLARNPADSVEPPQPEEKELIVLDEEQANRLLALAREDRHYLPVLIALTTGMRRGEILGLRWEDVDLRAGVLAIRQSLGKTKAGPEFGGPKTQKSKRLVELPALVVTALEAHRAAQEEQKALLGPAYRNSGLVAARVDGSLTTPDSFSHAFADLVRRAVEAGVIPRVTFHGLRHTHATHLLKLGVHPKVVSERLGHCNINITLDTYSHVMPGMQAEAARHMDVAFGEKENGG